MGILIYPGNSSLKKEIKDYIKFNSDINIIENNINNSEDKLSMSIIELSDENYLVNNDIDKIFKFSAKSIPILIVFSKERINNFADELCHLGVIPITNEDFKSIIRSPEFIRKIEKIDELIETEKEPETKKEMRNEFRKLWQKSMPRPQEACLR